jgi:hypothetical protein
LLFFLLFIDHLSSFKLTSTNRVFIHSFNWNTFFTFQPHYWTTLLNHIVEPHL